MVEAEVLIDNGKSAFTPVLVGKVPIVFDGDILVLGNVTAIGFCFLLNGTCLTPNMTGPQGPQGPAGENGTFLNGSDIEVGDILINGTVFLNGSGIQDWSEINLTGGAGFVNGSDIEVGLIIVGDNISLNGSSIFDWSEINLTSLPFINGSDIIVGIIVVNDNITLNGSTISDWSEINFSEQFVNGTGDVNVHALWVGTETLGNSTVLQGPSGITIITQDMNMSNGTIHNVFNITGSSPTHFFDKILLDGGIFGNGSGLFDLNASNATFATSAFFANSSGATVCDGTEVLLGNGSCINLTFQFINGSDIEVGTIIVENITLNGSSILDWSEVNLTYDLNVSTDSGSLFIADDEVWNLDGFGTVSTNSSGKTTTIVGTLHTNLTQQDIIDFATGNINSTSWLRSGTNVFLQNIDDFVGIGTITPSTELEVVGTVTAVAVIVNETFGLNGSNISDWGEINLTFVNGSDIEVGTIVATNITLNDSSILDWSDVNRSINETDIEIAFGSMFFINESANATTFTIVGQYENISVFEQDLTNLVGFPNGQHLQIEVPGVYSIAWGTSFVFQSASYGFGVAVNDELLNKTQKFEDTSGTGITEVGGNAFLNLSVGDNISLMVAQLDTPFKDITIIQANVNIGRISQ